MCVCVFMCFGLFDIFDIITPPAERSDYTGGGVGASLKSLWLP